MNFLILTFGCWDTRKQKFTWTEREKELVPIKTEKLPEHIVSVITYSPRSMASETEWIVPRNEPLTLEVNSVSVFPFPIQTICYHWPRRWWQPYICLIYDTKLHPVMRLVLELWIVWSPPSSCDYTLPIPPL